VPLKNDKGEIFAAVIVNRRHNRAEAHREWLMESEKNTEPFSRIQKTLFYLGCCVESLLMQPGLCRLFGYSKEEFLSMDRQGSTAIRKTGSCCGKGCTIGSVTD
jgi:hypothetical protein